MSDSDELVQLRVPSRRTFLQLLGASLALAGLDGCERTPPPHILPYGLAPDGVVPGVPTEYATSMTLAGFSSGLVVRSNEGRPTKIEGNPDHPLSLGKATLLQQASLLSLYDPDRAREVLHHGRPSSWDALAAQLRRPRDDRGRGLRMLAEPSASPTLARLFARLRATFPLAKITHYAPVTAIDHAVAGATIALGRPAQPDVDLSRADLILSLDADFLGATPSCLRDAHDWAQHRGGPTPSAPMSRVYLVECATSVTGTVADHRLRARSADILGVARAIARRIPAAASLGAEVELDARAARFADAVARELTRRPPGTSLVVVGERQPPALHALGWALNAALGNLGRTIHARAPLLLPDDQDLAALVAEMHGGAVDTLVLLEGNPVLTAPAELDFRAALDHVATRVHLAPYVDETATRCTWVVPAAHYLEAWGDGRAYDGTLTLAQPLIAAMYGGKTAIELCAAMLGDARAEGRALVQETHHGIDWPRAVQRGLVAGTATPTLAIDAHTIEHRAIVHALELDPGPGLELDFYPSPTIYDGRFANNAWLLEQPTPVEKVGWDNVALLSPALAEQRGVESGDLVEVTLDGRSVRLPAFVSPGHADGAISIWLGYGRQGGESIARGVGVDAYPLRRSGAPSFALGATMRKVAGRAALAISQPHHGQDGRPIALATTLAAYRMNAAFTAEQKGELPSLMPKVPREGLQWAMSIDLGLCTGCSACMVACQAENNLLVVGKEDVLKKREMHWLRIDTYFEGDRDPRFVHQPMMCQHCETAPCEYVCPVNATVHSPDGLNEMVYNRCVGTRFCSNNCPYKVRRFNWFDWSKRVAANQGSFVLAHNPDVTVRERGVMEKCTYCVQRIRTTQRHAEREGREVLPNEVRTACQQTCPTGAIEFGALSHTDTEMVRRRAEARSYEVLHEQGTRPRTMYLARIDNPNPELP